MARINDLGRVLLQGDRGGIYFGFLTEVELGEKEEPRVGFMIRMDERLFRECRPDILREAWVRETIRVVTEVIERQHDAAPPAPRH